MKNSELVTAAQKKLINAYAPYSKFPVSAALITKTGEVFHGVNVENASYGATICAERSAILSAVTAGFRYGDFQKIAIISNLSDPIAPCSICRQTIAEFFEPTAIVLMGQKNLDFKEVTVDELIPYSFTEKDLNGN